MHEVNLSGSYYEMGQIYGKMLKKTGFKPPVKSKALQRLADQCWEITEPIFPEIIDEIRGISDISGIDFNDLGRFLLTHPEAKTKGCTGFAITKDGETWMGRNYDWFYWFKDETESYYTSPKDGYRSLAQSDIFLGREDGVNEHGLGVAMFGIPSTFKPGVQFWVSIRYILDKCRNVEEAVKYLQETPHHCGYSVLMADKTGKKAVVEINPAENRVIWSEEDYLVCTNHLNHPDMVKHTIWTPPDSRPRYNKCNLELATMSSVDENRIMSLLRTHDGLVCSHIEEMKLGTIWSTVTNLNKLKVWKADGHPCTTPYVEDTRLG